MKARLRMNMIHRASIGAGRAAITVLLGGATAPTAMGENPRAGEATRWPSHGQVADRDHHNRAHNQNPRVTMPQAGVSGDEQERILVPSLTGGTDNVSHTTGDRWALRRVAVCALALSCGIPWERRSTSNRALEERA